MQWISVFQLLCCCEYIHRLKVLFQVKIMKNMRRVHRFLSQAIGSDFVKGTNVVSTDTFYFAVGLLIGRLLKGCRRGCYMLPATIAYNVQASLMDFCSHPPKVFMEQVPSGEILSFGDDNFIKYEETSVKQVQNDAFVLVAGGLGERLGYNGIKVALPMETTTEPVSYNTT